MEPLPDDPLDALLPLLLLLTAFFAGVALVLSAVYG